MNLDKMKSITEELYSNLKVIENYCISNKGYEKLDLITPIIVYNTKLADKLYILVRGEDG